MSFILNKDYIVNVMKEQIDGESVLRVECKDMNIVIRPRTLLRPTQIFVDAPTSETQTLITKTGLRVVELFADLRQIGLALNPLKVTQKELLEQKNVIS